MGGWIEIQMTKQTVIENKVAPLVGAWIEIYRAAIYNGYVGSLPLWERGLK